MIHGLDTGFLVAAEIIEHADHAAAQGVLARLMAAGDVIGIAPQVLAEFIHIVTDSRRFAKPPGREDGKRHCRTVVDSTGSHPRFPQ